MSGLKKRMQLSAFTQALIGSLILIAVTSIGLLSFGGEAKRELAFNPDPAFALLKATYSGSSSGAKLTYVLFADGRLLMESGGRAVWESLELELTYEQVTELLRYAVDAGLMEYDEEKVLREMDYRPRVVSVQDAGSLKLTIDLPSYQGPGQEGSVPKSTTIRFKGASAYAQEFPAIEELQGLAQIEAALQKYKEIAREKKDAK